MCISDQITHAYELNSTNTRHNKLAQDHTNLKLSHYSYLKLAVAPLGGWRGMVPPVPLPTRYKREDAVEQEKCEQGMPGPPRHLPPAYTPGGDKSGKHFKDSVPRIEAE